MRKGQRFQYKVHKPGKRDNKSRKADNLIREISQQNQYKRSQHYTGKDTMGNGIKKSQISNLSYLV